jgi:hypothetical protein
MINQILEEIEGFLGRFLIGCAIAIAGGLIGYFGAPILEGLGIM